MGVFFSRFRRKQTTIEVLETIDKEINSLQRNRKVNQDRQKQIVTSLLIYSIAAYIVAALIFFCVYFPDTWQLRFLYSIPLLIFPVMIWGIKKLLHWYFVKRLSSNDLALQELRERKRQILEDVMETETYKRAREILEKFDPARLRKSEGSSESGSPMAVAGTPGTVLTQRTIQTTTQQQVRGSSSMQARMQTPTSIPRPDISTIRPRQSLTPYPSTPILPQALGRPTPQSSFQSQAAAARGGFSGGYAPPPGPPLPRSILPQKRGTMDKLMDYLVGDGPENRYALICQQCYSHNGMALREEFEYLSFRCCYCYTLNPAKKQRPIAPRLEFFAPQGRKQEGIVISNEESDDEDVDKEGDDYSDDQESLESDTSAGIPPIQSSSTPMGVESPAGPPVQQAGQRTQLKFADAGQGRSRKPAEATSSNSSGESSKPDQANDRGHASSATHSPSITRSLATKIPETASTSKTPSVTRNQDTKIQDTASTSKTPSFTRNQDTKIPDTTSTSNTPSVTRNQVTKIPVSKGITDTSTTATSLEQKDSTHS